MNKTIKTAVLSIFALTLGLCACACGGEAKKDAKPQKSSSKVNTLPNYRYVDLDTILSRYNLAKDYNEEMLRMQNNAESQMRQHESKIKNFASSVQNKMQNNLYSTQEAYERDEKAMANMQNEAQRSMSSLQTSLAQAADQAQKSINDSITAFIESYNKTRGYDAILFKAATLYINPELDITDEVVEGLNARYNKMKK